MMLATRRADISAVVHRFIDLSDRFLVTESSQVLA
jgi:hypothetical protein